MNAVVKVLGFVTFLSVTAAIPVSYVQNTRYDLKTMDRGVAYKIDKRTGETWLLTADEQKLVRDDELNGPNTIAEAAIVLAKEFQPVGRSGPAQWTLTEKVSLSRGDIKFASVKDGTEQGAFFEVLPR